MLMQEYLEFLYKRRNTYKYYQYEMFSCKDITNLTDQFMSDANEDMKMIFEKKSELPVIQKAESILKDEIERTLRMLYYVSELKRC